MKNVDHETNMLSKKSIFISVAVISLGFFMTTLDASVVNVALPVIQGYFHETQATAEWVITVYLLVISGSVLCFGKLSDIKGRKKLMVMGFSVFTLSSIICGLSMNFPMLIIARGMQALGGAMVMSSGPAIITDIVPKTSRGKAFSATAISLSLALCAGPVVGGIFTSTFGFRSIFYLNIPFGVISILLAILNLPSDQVKKKVTFDIFGSILFCSSLAFIVFSLDMMETPEEKLLSLILLAVGIILLLGFIMWEAHSSNPLLKISLFKNKSFIAGNGSLLLVFIMQYGFIYITPYFFEKHWMMSASAAGQAMLPITVAMMCVAPLSGILADRFKIHIICTVGMLITAVSIFILCYGLTIKSSMLYWNVCSSTAGIGCGLFQTPNMKQIMDSVSAENRGIASGIRSTVINMGEIFGVAITGVIYSTFLDIFDHKVQGNSLGFASATYAYRIVFLSLGMITVLAAIISFLGGKSKSTLTVTNNR